MSWRFQEAYRMSDFPLINLFLITCNNTNDCAREDILIRLQRKIIRQQTRSALNSKKDFCVYWCNENDTSAC